MAADPDTPTPDDLLDYADEPWANTVGHLLWEVGARVALLGEANLADTGLSPAAVGLLDQIASAPGISIAEIARRMPKSPQAVSQMTARLERLGYLERRLAGGRAIGLHVTEAGAEARRRGNEAEERFERVMQDALGDERHAALRDLLRATRSIAARMQAERD
jgi:DNA-binding MarR family transcriptional regulator